MHTPNPVRTSAAHETNPIDSGRGHPDLLTGLFPDRMSAEHAYNSITSRGYDKGDIHLVMSESTRKAHFSDTENVDTDLGNKAAEGAGVGGAIGGTVGAIVAAVAAVGSSIVVPGLGLVIAGPIAAALAGAGAGGLTGGLVGALVGWNIPAERVKLYQDGIDKGGILMAVKPRNAADAEHFEREWKSSQGQDVYR